MNFLKDNFTCLGLTSFGLGHSAPLRPARLSGTGGKIIFQEIHRYPPITFTLNYIESSFEYIGWKALCIFETYIVKHYRLEISFAWLGIISQCAVTLALF